MDQSLSQHQVVLQRVRTGLLPEIVDQAIGLPGCAGWMVHLVTSTAMLNLIITGIRHDYKLVGCLGRIGSGYVKNPTQLGALVRLKGSTQILPLLRHSHSPHKLTSCFNVRYL